MKTIDYVKKHIKEWPKGCDYICVDDDNQIWLNSGDPDDASYDTTCGNWTSDHYDSIPQYEDVDLEDNDKVILKRDFGEKNNSDNRGTEEEVKMTNKDWSMDDFNERLKALLREAGQNGVAVKEVVASYIDSSGMGNRKWVLVDVDVEYRM